MWCVHLHPAFFCVSAANTKSDKDRWIQEKCKEIQQSFDHSKTKKAYGLIKEIKKKYEPRMNNIKDKTGKLLTEKQEVTHRWVEYCKELYSDSGVQDLSVLTELESIAPPTNKENNDIMKEEVEKAIRKLKDNKATGTDGIPAELIKAGGEKLVELFHQLCQKIWREENIPTDWVKSLLILIPKKGDRKECGNYRTISLINHSSKILLTILLERLQGNIEPFLSDEQAGFRKDRSTVQQILCLRLIAEKHREVDQEVYNCFVDFKKAFDLVWHEGLWAVLRSYGINQKLITILQNIYKDTMAAVLVNGEISEWFPITVGTRQGDPISPSAFIIFLERIMDAVYELSEKGVKIQGRELYNLKFADDIDLLDKTYERLQNQLEKLDAESKRYGMQINRDKTKTMIFHRKEAKPRVKIKLNGTELEEVDNFIYLGAKVTWNNDCTEEIKRRIQLATAAYRDLKIVWNDRGIRIDTKVQLLWTCVFSVFLYAAETWTINSADTRRVLAFETSCYRWLLGITWQEHVRNEEVRRIIGRRETIMDIIKTRKLKLFGHIARMNDDRLLKLVTFGSIEGKRPRGRPPRRWIDDITDWCQANIYGTLQLAMNRDRWREFTTSPDGHLTMGQ